MKLTLCTQCREFITVPLNTLSSALHTCTDIYLDQWCHKIGISDKTWGSYILVSQHMTYYFISDEDKGNLYISYMIYHTHWGDISNDIMYT